MVCELALNLFTTFPAAPSVAYAVQHAAAMGMWCFLAYHFYAREDTRKSPLYDPRGYLASIADGGGDDDGDGGGGALRGDGGGEDGGPGGGSRPRHVVFGGALAERIPPASASQTNAAAPPPPAYQLM